MSALKLFDCMIPQISEQQDYRTQFFGKGVKN